MRLQQRWLLAVAGVALWLAMLRGGAAQLGNEPLGSDRVAARAADFLTQVSVDNVGSGLDGLLARSPLARDAGRVEKLREGIVRTLARHGSFQRIERLKLERVGQSLVRCTYLYHCSDYPLVWRFTFYRPGDDPLGDWMVIGLAFDVDYDKLPGSGGAG